MVLTYEVLQIKRIFIVSIIGVCLFALFSGKDISIESKLFAIFITIVFNLFFLETFYQYSKVFKWRFI